MPLSTQFCVRCGKPVCKIRVRAGNKTHLVGKLCRFHQRLHWTETSKRRRLLHDPLIGTRKVGRLPKATPCRCGVPCVSARMARDHCRQPLPPWALRSRMAWPEDYCRVEIPLTRERLDR